MHMYFHVCGILTGPLATRTDAGLPFTLPLDVFLVIGGGRVGRLSAEGLLEEGCEDSGRGVEEMSGRTEEEGRMEERKCSVE